MQFLASQIEIALGAWLILGRWRAAAWISACLLLVTFTGISLVSALRGQSDCGCFGSLKVHPGWTTAINLGLLGLLVLFRSRVKWSENRGTLAVVGILSVLTGGMAWTANGPLGERLLARWHGRTVYLRSGVVEAGEASEGTVKRLQVTVTNASSRDVRIIGGTANCSCTTTQNLPTTIPADGDVVVEIEIQFRGTPGQFEYKFEFFLPTTERNPNYTG